MTDEFCSAPHPDPRYHFPKDVTESVKVDGKWVTTTETITASYVCCRRLLGHPGDHAAYTFKITEPETWPCVDAEQCPDSEPPF